MRSTRRKAHGEPTTPSQLTGPPWLELAAKMLKGMPALPNALCRGNAAVFDGQTTADIAAAPAAVSAL